MQNKKFGFWILCALLAVVCAVYIPSLRNSFTNWDDNVYIAENPQIYILGLNNIKTIFTSDVSGVYSPLTILSFAVEYHFVGANPFIYHLDNLILHLLIVVLVYIWVLQMGFSIIVAGFVAFLFGIHPMHVESVAWVTERKDVLYSFFYLLALLSYGKFIKSNQIKFYVYAIVLGILSMLAKPMALSLPFIFLLQDWWFGRRWSWKLVWEKIPHVLYIVPITLITYMQHARMPGKGNAIDAILIWIYSFSFYINKFFFPLELTPKYQLPKPFSILNIHYLLAVVIFVGCLYVVFYRRWRVLTYALLYYFLSIFFLLRFDEGTDLNIVADRFMYLPSLGLCVLVGYVLEKWLGSKKINRRIVILIVSFIVLLLIYKTYVMTTVWKNSLTLWSYVIKHNPNLAIAYNNRGEAYSQGGQYDLAVADYDRALALDPMHASSFNNRADAYLVRGDEEKALEDYSKAIKINTGFQSYYNRANIFLKRGDYASALKDYNEAISINALAPQAYNNRGVLYLQKSEWEAAARDFGQAIAIDPRFFDAYNNHGYALMQMGRLDEALKDFDKSLDLNPHHGISYYNRANAHRLKGEMDLALEDFTKAAQYLPGNGFVYYFRSQVYAHQKNWAKALYDALKAKEFGIEGTLPYIESIKAQLQKQKL